jgi:hypothetical protein
MIGAPSIDVHARVIDPLFDLGDIPPIPEHACLFGLTLCGGANGVAGMYSISLSLAKD